MAIFGDFGPCKGILWILQRFLHVFNVGILREKNTQKMAFFGVFRGGLLKQQIMTHEY